jgi:SAM-dependent methyltransferase
MRNAETEYNDVAYPSAVYPQTHPDRLATIGRLFGLPAAAVENARVLELGCGDGTNLVAMADVLRDAHFTGIDLASAPIQRGHETLKALNISNVDLQVGDILQFSLGAARFDFIIAHGLYSWVPGVVRDRILQICRDHLAPEGIAYISYNAYPGNHLRDLVRGMMQYHARNFRDPLQQIRQARGLLKLVSDARAEPEPFHQVVKQEFERCLKYTDAGFYHDDLCALNQPVYFWQFAEHAQAFGLQYLAEADIADMQTDGLAPQVLEVLKGLDPRNFIAREQYLDFFKGRAFRQTLLCRHEARIDRELKPERIADLLVSADVRSAAIDGDAEDFAGPRGAVITTHDSVARSALNRLGEIWPKRIPVRELCPSDSAHLLAFLARAYEIGFIELHTWSPGFVTKISNRPVVTAMARYQAGISDAVPTLRHRTLQLDGPIARKLVCLLDGTRNREELLQQLSGHDRSFDGEALDMLLRHLARTGLLLG